MGCVWLESMVSEGLLGEATSEGRSNGGAVSPEICRESARGRKKDHEKFRRGDVPAMLT